MNDWLRLLLEEVERRRREAEDAVPRPDADEPAPGESGPGTADGKAAR